MSFMIVPHWFSATAPQSDAVFFAGKTNGYTAGTTQTISLEDLKDASNNSVTLAQNDVIVVSMSRTSTVNVAAADLSPTTAGYTLVADLYANNPWDCNFGVNYKVMGASPDTSVDLPGTGGGGMAYTIYAIRGVDTANPLDVAATTATGINASVPDPASITPSTAGSLITVHGASSASDGQPSSVFTNPGDLSSTTNHFLSYSQDGSGAGGSQVGTGIKEDWASGAFDPLAWGGGPPNPGSNSWCAVTIAWRPA